jgi:putative hydrolase of HD superfamily
MVYRNTGAAWQRHGATRDRVLARNAHIADGSEMLWAHARARVAEATAHGHLAE